jgi:sortase B
MADGKHNKRKSLEASPQDLRKHSAYSRTTHDAQEFQGLQDKRKRRKKRKSANVMFFIFLAIFIISLACLAYYGINRYVMPEREFTKLAQQSSEIAKLNEQNGACVGWVKVEDTRIDYPVMFTPSDPEKYLHLDFEKNYSAAGTPFIGEGCDMESNSIIVYGHHMRVGTMFANLTKFEDVDFAKSHDIEFETLMRAKASYQVVAVVRCDLTSSDYYKFWNHVGDLTEDEYEEFVQTMKGLSSIDTGVEPKYGQNLLMLSTCTYGTDDERLVVLAVQK